MRLSSLICFFCFFKSSFCICLRLFACFFGFCRFFLRFLGIFQTFAINRVCGDLNCFCGTCKCFFFCSLCSFFFCYNCFLCRYRLACFCSFCFCLFNGFFFCRNSRLSLHNCFFCFCNNGWTCLFRKGFCTIDSFCFLIDKRVRFICSTLGIFEHLCGFRYFLIRFLSFCFFCSNFFFCRYRRSSCFHNLRLWRFHIHWFWSDFFCAYCVK